MSAVFRLPSDDAIEVSPSWVLAEQIRDVSRWLERPENADAVRGSILDVGFSSRLSSEIAVQGETIPHEFMRTLVALGVTLWLSLYPPFRQ